ncbi:MAG: hypothetical protein O3A51_03345 [Verrucomicrobia bacterium]|nr:hypothetical protein [Verrucomicrobiota bacterium]
MDPIDPTSVSSVTQLATAYERPDVDGVRLGRPDVLSLPGGRLLVAVDLVGPGVRDLPGIKGRTPNSKHWAQGKLLTSTDGGQHWIHKHDIPFSHGCLFRDGSALYLAGQSGPPYLMKSSDGGETWSKPILLAAKGDGEAIYAHSPISVTMTDEHVVMPLMRVTQPGGRRILNAQLAPVCLWARRGANLMTRNSWSLSQPVKSFAEWTADLSFGPFGVPFYAVPDPSRGADAGNRRWAHQPGWLLPHALRIQDPNHEWFDPRGKTLHLLTCADTHRSHFAAIMRARFESDTLTISPQTTPAGGPYLLAPIPGGHAKFDVVYDDPSGHFWLISNQSRSSLTRADQLLRGHPGLPADERAILQLSFSRNLVDWSFAAYIDGAEGGVRADPAMTIQGEDMFIVCAASAEGETGRPTRVPVYKLTNFRSRLYGLAAAG